MSLRRKARECALQMLFQWDMAQQSAAQIEKNYWKVARGAEETRTFANQLFEGAMKQAEASDNLIGQTSRNWKLDRLAAIDRTILRLAIYELCAHTAPVGVVIDEALELAKKFSSDDAPAFVNAILDAAAKSLRETS